MESTIKFEDLPEIDYADCSKHTRKCSVTRYYGSFKRTMIVIKIYLVMKINI